MKFCKFATKLQRPRLAPTQSHAPTMKTTPKRRSNQIASQPSSRPHLATSLTQLPRSSAGPRSCLVPPTTLSFCSGVFTPKKKSGSARHPSQSAFAKQLPPKHYSTSIVSPVALGNQFWSSRLSEEAAPRTPSSPPLYVTRFSAPKPRLSFPPPSPALVSNIRRSSLAPATGSFNKDPILSSCVLCQPLTTVQVSRHPSSTRRISAFAEEDDDVLRSLASIGVVFDHQMEIVLGLDSPIVEQLAGETGSLRRSMKYRLLYLVERAKERRSESTQMSTQVNGARITDIIQVPCPQHHPLVDISAMTGDLRSLLQMFGIEELMPAVALIGLLTLADFMVFCTLSESARKTMIMNAGIQLNHFQSFMLNRTLQANAIG